jgi:hypothetical protein
MSDEILSLITLHLSLITSLITLHLLLALCRDDKIRAIPHGPLLLTSLIMETSQPGVTISEDLRRSRLDVVIRVVHISTAGVPSNAGIGKDRTGPRDGPICRTG